MTDKIWARVADGAVAELIPLDAGLVPGKDIFTPDIAETLVDVTGVSPAPQPGWSYDGHVFAAPAATAPVAIVPASISRRQFFQQLAVQGTITEPEALAAVQTGAIPSEMQPLVAGLPQAEQFGATMLIAGASSFDRDNPLTMAMGQAYGWSSGQIDALWVAAAAL
jgi:hypothetical protein